MNEYVKINSLWKRDERGKIIEGDWAVPEFAFLRNCDWEWAEKVDGTNIRVGWDGAVVEFGGRTDNAQIPAKLVSALRAMFPPEKFAATFDGPCVLYGEGYGAGIQSGGNYYPEQTFVLFDVLAGPWWLRRPDVQDVATKMGIDVVPVVGTGTLMWANETVKAGITSSWGDFQAEGLVGRPAETLFNRRGERIMAKVKTRDWASR